MSFARTAYVTFRKDLAIELRTKEIVTTTGLFAVLVALVASLAFYLDASRARAIAPGVIWISITFAGLLAMTRSWARERENDAFRMLLTAPVPRAGIYVGKVMASFVFACVIEVVLVPFAAMLFRVDLAAVAGPLLALLALGTFGFVVTATLFSALTIKSSARDLMLSIVIFPLITPSLLASVAGTRELFGGAPIADVLDWMRLLGAYDVAMLTAGAWLFGPLVAD